MVSFCFRCFLGQNAGPAQRPDCNRYMQAIIDKLCAAYPGNVVQNGNRVLRWTLILRAYQNIKTLVVQCSKVMSDTAIQLVDINQSTLTQWYVNLNIRINISVLSSAAYLRTH